MAQYIDKDALVAEIDKLKEKYSKCPTRIDYEDGLKEGRLIGYKDALWKINSLEVKEEEKGVGMTREEMLKRYIVRESETEQAANVYLDGVFGGGKHQDLYVRLFMAGAQWADQHPKDNLVDIDTACEWVKENIKNYVWCRFDEICISENIEKDFKQATKGE